MLCPTDPPLRSSVCTASVSAADVAAEPARPFRFKCSPSNRLTGCLLPIVRCCSVCSTVPACGMAPVRGVMRPGGRPGSPDTPGWGAAAGCGGVSACCAAASQGMRFCAMLCDCPLLPDLLAALALAVCDTAKLWERRMSQSPPFGVMLAPPSLHSRRGITLACLNPRAAPMPLVWVGRGSNIPAHSGDSSIDWVSGMTRRCRGPSGSTRPEPCSRSLPWDTCARLRGSCERCELAYACRVGDSSR